MKGEGNEKCDKSSISYPPLLSSMYVPVSSLFSKWKKLTLFFYFSTDAKTFAIVSTPKTVIILRGMGKYFDFWLRCSEIEIISYQLKFLRKKTNQNGRNGIKLVAFWQIAVDYLSNLVYSKQKWKTEDDSMWIMTMLSPLSPGTFI